MRKVISFLGAQQLSETVYELDGERCASRYMAHASAQFFEPHVLYIVVTSEARRANYEALRERVAELGYDEDGTDRQLVPIDIPSGKSEEELWEIFDRIAAHVKQNDILFFDVTNAFRSLPILAILVTNFVRVARSATVERIVYGAFEARLPDGPTPVFDLTPFVRLLDWTTATNALLRYGQTDGLTTLAASTPSLTSVATTLQHLTKALQTSRPQEIMETAQILEKQMSELPEDDRSDVQPFFLLRDTLANEYHKLAHPKPTNPALAYEVIAKQLDVIDWYVDKGMLVQALTATREWLVSLVLMRAGRDLFNKTQREHAEQVLWRRPSPLQSTSIAKLEQTREVWQLVTKPRNTVAHGGMDTRMLTAQEIEQAVKDVHGKLRGLLVESSQ